MSNREALRSALAELKKNKPARVKVTEIDEPIYVRKLTLGEVERYAADAKSGDQSRIALSVARVLVDDQGELLYDPDNAEDIKDLSEMPWTLISRILDESNKVNALVEEGVKELEKN